MKNKELEKAAKKLTDAYKAWIEANMAYNMMLNSTLTTLNTMQTITVNWKKKK